MHNHSTQHSDAAVRRARFGALPERIAHEDMVEMKAASSREPERGAGNPGAGRLLACLAWDLAL